MWLWCLLIKNRASQKNSIINTCLLHGIKTVPPPQMQAAFSVYNSLVNTVVTTPNTYAYNAFKPPPQCSGQGSHSFTDKKSRTFPGLYRTTMKNFPGPFRSLRMFKYKEKTAFTYNIQSVVHCRKFSIKQNVDVSCSEFRWTYLHMVSTYMPWL